MLIAGGTLDLSLCNFWDSRNKHGQGALPCSLSMFVLYTGVMCLVCAFQILLDSDLHTLNMHLLRECFSLESYFNICFALTRSDFLSFCPRYLITCSTNTKCKCSQTWTGSVYSIGKTGNRP